jgi:iron complex outermembrane receptor protein
LHRGRPYLGSQVTALLLAIFTVAAAQGPQAPGGIIELKKIPFEELFDIEITSVSRRPERLIGAASAIQVITAEDIHRSGASSLPEALRLASNLQVAQIHSFDWAISARGFNALTANKLLVLIDGRTVYTPLFSGVFWDAQQVMLEDIDRIEVISGPGAALWGANAVNGVINIITRSARDTQGALLSAGGGSHLRRFGSGRYGGRLGGDLYYRVYGMGFARDETFLRSGSGASNDWHVGQGGFRADLPRPDGTTLSVQGNFYGGDLGLAPPRDLTTDGQNLLGRWTRPLAGDGDLSVQLYWDRTHRRNPRIFSEALNTYDLEVQHRFRLGEGHKILWGGGYRLMLDRVLNGPLPNFAFYPAHRTLHLFSALLQDEITLLRDRLFLTAGAMFEHNSFSGFEVQPTARLAWTPAENHTLWAAVSRAVRSPSRIDTEIFIPARPPFFIRGGGGRFDSEELIAYELGYRTEVSRRLALSVSAFFNDYDNLRSVEPVAGAPGQFIIRNRLEANTYGAELAATWRALDWWRLRGGYTYFRKEISLDRSRDIARGRNEGNDPHHQLLLQSMINFWRHFEFDSVLRYVDNLNQRGPVVPSYVTLDLRLGWNAMRGLEFAIVGQNLLDKRHAEFGAPAMRQEIPRSVYGKVTWKFWTGDGNQPR